MLYGLTRLSLDNLGKSLSFTLPFLNFGFRPLMRIFFDVSESAVISKRFFFDPKPLHCRIFGLADMLIMSRVHLPAFFALWQ